MKTKIENGIKYVMRDGDGIWFPNFRVKEENIQLGKYGMIRKAYLPL